MKILFDENVPWALKKFLRGHDVFSVRRMNWGAVRNGELLKNADPIFDVFLTVDKNIPYQQNLAGKKISVIVLQSKFIKLDDLIPLVPELLRQLSLLQPGSGTLINILPP